MEKATEAGRLAYLTLQSTSEGQAAHAHVKEIVAGLRFGGLQVDLYEPRYNSSTTPSVATRVRTFIQIQWRLCRRMNQYDVIYLRGHTFAYPVACLAHKRGKPIIIECNGPYDDLFLAWPKTRFAKRLFIGMLRRQFELATTNIAVTSKLRDWINDEASRADSVVIPNGANVMLFHPGAARPIVLPEKYVVFFGALAPWQGTETMLEAVFLPEWPQDVHLIFVGDGALKKRVDSASLKDRRIHATGRLPYEQVAGVVANSIASISIQGAQPRCQHGLSPLKVYESMACGVPTVVSDLPGLRELIEEARAGVVIPPDAPIALARAVTAIASSPDWARSMGDNGRKQAVRHHSWGARAQQTLLVIDDALSAPPKHKHKHKGNQCNSSKVEPPFPGELSLALDEGPAITMQIESADQNGNTCFTLGSAQRD